ncbi:MAG: DNA-binding response regulator [Variovorax paradoxus]|nr:MAG: DNA-binding response regulator [Variovorax paradoxus]PZQ01161.1 MAG: DNA-binding response regulator [Variovorax paradoxus]
MQILIVEDEVKLAQYLQKGLREEGFSVDVAHDGVTGLEATAQNRYDVIILDGMLPGLDGLAVLAALRQSQSTPVVMLTARGEIEDRVLGLSSGADDYLVKPFAFPELVARIRGLLRRASNKSPVESTVLRVADLEVDLLRRRVTRAGQRLELTNKEFSLLVLLMRREGAVVSRSELASQVWGMNFDSETNVVDVAVRRLRTKVDYPFESQLLHTVRGMGYVLEIRSAT